MNETKTDLIERTETWATQHSRSPVPGEADRARDVLAVCRIARAAVTIGTLLLEMEEELFELRQSIDAAK